MVELILTVNLAFSICGFFFIMRMWKEVKTRRDYYGENFGLPRGKEKEAPPEPPVTYSQPSMSNEQIAQIMAAMQKAQEPEPEPEPEPIKEEMKFTEGDLQKLMAAIAQQGGKG